LLRSRTHFTLYLAVNLDAGILTYASLQPAPSVPGLNYSHGFYGDMPLSVAPPKALYTLRNDEKAARKLAKVTR
jgi:hypothetical protein